ncbi:MAG: protein kinase, partial [Chthoniobacteraceae bacterium]
MASSPDSASNDSAPPQSRWARATSGAGTDDGREALRELAGSYWYCVYAWWRRAGLEASRAAAATLASFTRWLGDAPPTAEDSGVARMREWLPARLAEQAASELKLSGRAALEIEAAWAAQRYADEPHGEPVAIFQRRWALTVLEFTTTTLQAEYAARGEEALFNELLPFAGFEPGDDERYASAASRTGRTSGAMRKAVFDFRTRQRELLRAYAGDTVIDSADIDSELTALLCACEAAGVQMTPLPGMETSPAPLPTAIRALRPDEVFARAMQSVRMTHAGPGGWTPPTVEEAARLFPQYEVLALLGRGGMGAVYQARQIELDRLVAIKLLPLEVSVDRDFADRFRREARAMAKLDHPNIIAVYDFGTTSEGHLYFTMAFVEGTDLQHLIHKVGLAPDQALALAGQVCTALAYAHGKGIIHRDIKPANVMVNLDGQAKVADFGLARLAEASPESLGMTRTGIVMGTPDYMAPEQTRGMHVDHRADIYSLGVMLYEMLCREVPKGAFQRPSERIGCDSRIDQLVLKAMQQAPERRYQSTTEMKTDVDAARTALPAADPVKGKPAPVPAPGKSRAPLLVVIAATAVLALGAAAWMHFGGVRHSTEKPPAGDAAAATLSPVAETPAATPLVAVASPGPAKVPPAATPPPLVKSSEVLTFDRHRYQLVRADSVTRDAAKAKAEALGGHLATFTTEEEEVWVRRNLLEPLDTADVRFWIGGGAEENSADVRWPDGQPVGKLHWIGGNPGWRAADHHEGKLAAGLLVSPPNGGGSWVSIAPARHIYSGFVVEWDDGKRDPGPAPAPEAPAPAPV